VSGGNGGIGRGIALGLAQAGSAVAVLARNEEKNQPSDDASSKQLIHDSRPTNQDADQGWIVKHLRIRNGRTAAVDSTFRKRSQMIATARLEA
jgi:NAD(P)-dependent dehydrogenase (short-subunit alcohol dehydrogenase family)